MARTIHTLLLCSLFLFVACSETTTNGEQEASDTSAPPPPLSDTAAARSASPERTTDITQYIRTAMPAWTVPDKEEWEKYWYDRYKKDRNTVYRVQSDFDGNGQRDYAFILKDTTGKYAVWAFLQGGATFQPYRVYDITRLADRKLHVGLGVLKAGTYDDLNTVDTVPAKVQTSHPAIHVVFFETAAKAYYWQDSTFHQIQTGD